MLSFQSPMIIALTVQGKRLAQRLADQIDGSDVWYKPQPFSEKVQHVFVAGHPLIFICAAGIVMRTLAPVLKNKKEDPPVLVLDENGQFVIPLLSGHEGGANQWGQVVADTINAQLVITSAHRYLKPYYFIGVGCERDCPKEYINALVSDCLRQANISIDQVAGVYSIDLKSDEQGIIDCAAQYDKPFHTFSVKELLTVEHLLQSPSDYVYKTVGVYGVAESSALYAAKKYNSDAVMELIVTKQKNAKATCAIVRMYKE
ncbi:cobalt-precorrin 5A hydrolase [Eionea flava]